MIVMTKSNLPKSIRIHIRKEKARLRHRGLDAEAQKKAYLALYAKFGITYSKDM